jgi:outer membrane protein
VNYAGSLLAIMSMLLPGSAVVAQEAATMTLAEAIALARRNNPDYLAQQNDAGVADWAVREAYGALLPGASVSTSFGWQGAGTPRFGIFTGDDFGIGETTSYYSSSYSLGLNYRLTGASLLAPRQEKANRRATEATIDAAGSALDRAVTTQYLTVLRAQDGVTLARAELERARENLKFAEARVQVGAAIALETKQAQVETGRAEVALLQAENAVQVELHRLMQQIGVPLERAVTLTSTFSVIQLPFTQQDLITMAAEQNPELRSARARADASASTVRMARSAYLPSLNVSAGWSGFTRQAANDDFLVQQAMDQVDSQVASCQLLNQISSGLLRPLPGTPADCSAFTLTPEQEARIRASNQVFPFDFTREPLGISLSLSLPIFQGFSRERQIEEAKAFRSDAEHRLRAEQLRIRTEVTTGYLATVTAQKSVALEEGNRQLADEQLAVARERYRVGVGTFLELREAETVKARADRAYLNAVYEFQLALSGLENAVGRPLRQAGETR